MHSDPNAECCYVRADGNYNNYGRRKEMKLNFLTTDRFHSQHNFLKSLKKSFIKDGIAT